MKLFFTTLLLIFAAMQPQLQAQQCAPAHHVNPPFLVIPDTVRDWHPLEFESCFGNAICSDFTNPFSEIVNFDISTALVGHFAIISTGHPASHQTALTIMSRDCDSVLAQKCLNWPVDTLKFRNTTSKFSLWYQAEHDTFVVTYTGYFVGGTPANFPFPCDPTTATTNPIQPQPTYTKFDAIRGTTSDASTEQPHGLSRRSDGQLVMRQGLPDGLCMLAMIAFILRVSWPWLRSVLRMPAIAPHPDDEDQD